MFNHYIKINFQKKEYYIITKKRQNLTVPQAISTAFQNQIKFLKYVKTYYILFFLMDLF